MSRHALGIDYSTKKMALAHIPPPELVPMHAVASMALPPRETDYNKNFATVTGFAAARIAQLSADPFFDPDNWTVAIELPIVGHSGASQTAIRMSMVCGALYMMCIDVFGTDRVRLVSVSSWKKEVCGKGNLDKSQVGEWLSSNRPDLWHMCSNDDEVDATCLALWAGTR